MYVLFNKVLYLYSKLVKNLHYPSIRDSEIHGTSNIGSGSNVVRLTMGKHSYMGNYNSVMDTKIGNFCSIASYCAIGGGEHPIEWVSTSPCFYSQHSAIDKEFSGNNFSSGVTVNVGNDVWIGESCFIKSGVHIGNGAIIGAHAVVTKDIPDYAIVVGCPAKVLKYRFEPEVIEDLLNIKWWDFDDFQLEKYAHLFNDPKMFIKIYKKKL